MGGFLGGWSEKESGNGCRWVDLSRIVSPIHPHPPSFHSFFTPIPSIFHLFSSPSPPLFHHSTTPSFTVSSNLKKHINAMHSAIKPVKRRNARGGGIAGGGWGGGGGNGCGDCYGGFYHYFSFHLY